MENAAKATEPLPNAAITDGEDRAASAQLYWMLLMICKGAALNTVFLAGDSERSLEATDREVRAEDENPVRRSTDVHPVLFVPGRHN